MQDTLEQILQNLLLRPKKQREMVIYTSGDNLEYMNAMLGSDKEKMREVSERMNKKLSESEAQYKAAFLQKYSQQIFDFISAIIKGRWLIGFFPYEYVELASWKFITEDENMQDYNDDYYCVYFWKGQYQFTLNYAGGYAGTAILEKNLTEQRVTDLIKNQPQQQP